MMRMNTRNLLLTALLATLIVGCSSNKDKKTYQVIVDNRSDRPVTVWLTTNKPVKEYEWVSPEELAIVNPDEQDPDNKVVIPAGKVGSTGTVPAKFKDNIDAVLRVYVGERSFDEVLAMSKGNPNRIDLRLQPGVNELTVNEEAGRIVVLRGTPTTAPAN